MIMMTSKIKRILRMYKVTYVVDEGDFSEVYITDRIIHIGESLSNDFVAVIFHELAHILIGNNTYDSNSGLLRYIEERDVWALSVELLKFHGYRWTKARQTTLDVCLATYKPKPIQIVTFIGNLWERFRHV